jgi:hypothetical protein
VLESLRRPVRLEAQAASANGWAAGAAGAVDRLPAMPNKPKTPVRGLRVDEDLWRAAQDKAEAEGRTMTAVIVAYLKRYVSTPPRAKADDGE